jgi:hypothetical protein
MTASACAESAVRYYQKIAFCLLCVAVELSMAA